MYCDMYCGGMISQWSKRNYVSIVIVIQFDRPAGRVAEIVVLEKAWLDIVQPIFYYCA